MENECLTKLLSVDEGIGVCWLGNLSWLIYSDGQLIAFDLDLDGRRRTNESPIPITEIAKVLDLHIITHEHGDHFNEHTSQILSDESECLFIVPANCLNKANQIGLSENRIHVASPGKSFDLSGIKVEPQRALHGHLRSSVYKRANFEDCGYILTLAGKRILQPGDTVLLAEHLEMQDIDVLFVSPTEHNTYIDNSAIMINSINPQYIFPQHYGTYIQNEQNYFWTKGYVDELRAELPIPMQQRFHQLEQGEVFIIK